MHTRTPLYPGACAPDEPMVLMPLFSRKGCACKPPRPCEPPRPPKNCACAPACAPHGVPAAPPVCVVNPFNPCERATVLLSIDECGNLIVCLKR